MTLKERIENNIGILALVYGSSIVAATLGADAYLDGKLQSPDHTGVSLEDHEISRTDLPVVLSGRNAITEAGACFDCLGYGPFISNDGNNPQYNAAFWELELSHAGTYAISMRFATKDSRPGLIIVNGGPALEGRFGEVTGGWKNVMPFAQGCSNFVAGTNSIRIEHLTAFPHIESLTISEAVDGSC